MGSRRIAFFDQKGHLALLSLRVRLALVCSGIAVAPSPLATLASAGFAKASLGHWTTTGTVFCGAFGLQCDCSFGCLQTPSCRSTSERRASCLTCVNSAVQHLLRLIFVSLLSHL